MKVEAVFKQGLETPGSIIMDFAMEKEEGVYPLVPAGDPMMLLM